VARRMELLGSLPGVFDSTWRGRDKAVCLTGNCQMALIWLRLYDLTGDATLLNAAFKAIDEVKRAQDLNNPNPGIRGGIPGSFPIWDEYISNAIPNWAAKFFIDALLAKQKTLSNLAKRPQQILKIPRELPQLPPVIPLQPTSRPQRQRIVLVATGIGSTKLRRMLEAWRSWNFVPVAVVIENPPAQPLITRFVQIVRNEGIWGIIQRLPLPGIPRSQAHIPDNGGSPVSVVEFCIGSGITILELESLTSLSALQAVKAIQPDLLVQAGTGIIRRPLLAVSRLGMINAHMGILPFYRGMNVAEWAAFNGDPAGCSVHVIDEGIDTGDIIAVRPVNAARANSIAALRDLIDVAQIELLGEVVRYVVATGELPPRHPQHADEGCQFFTMHPEIRHFLEIKLSASASPRTTC
jgi:methionyl-tRNA formyltransferase